MIKHIVVQIDLEGEITIEAMGFKGAECAEATKAIEEALGVKTGGSKKPEYYQSATQVQHQIGG